MTNTELLAAISRAVNDSTFTKRTKTVMLGVMTDAQNYIIERTECLKQTDSTSITLAASDGNYDLPNTFVKFPSVGEDVKRSFVSIGTNGKYPLTFIPLYILNNQYPNWRATTAGTPEFYSVVESGTPELIVYPKPSSAFLTSNGTTVYMDVVYKPTGTLAENANLPFDNAYRFSGLFHILLRLRSIWQIKLEDMQFADADRLELRLEKLTEEAINLVQTLAVSPGQHGFEETLA